MIRVDAGPRVCAERLFESFRNGPGVFGKTRENMPEFFYLRGVRPEDRVNVLTITAALDYQTDADRLWQAAVETYLDPATVWLFAMDEVAERDVDLSLDEPLWLLSRDGCSGTDDQDGCARAGKCVVAEFCVFQNGGD